MNGLNAASADAGTTAEDGLTVTATRATCMGAGQCVFAAPEVFDQDDDGLVLVLTPTVTDAAQAALVREAVQVCPSRSVTATPIQAG